VRDIDRIVVMNDYSEPEGGAGVLALQSVSQYRRLGYPVTFLTGQDSTAELKDINVDVVGLKSKALLDLPASHALRLGFHNRGAEQLVSRWIDQFDTPRTVYHLHNWSQIFSPAVFRALRPVEARTVVTCHDFFNICPNGGFLNFRKSKVCELRPLSAHCLLSQCDRRNVAHKYWRTARQFHLNQMARFSSSSCTFTFIHERMREKFSRAGFEAPDLVTIPNPAEPWSTRRIRAEENSRFLFVGRIGKDKGADIALEGAKGANREITMVGTGELDAQLRLAYPEAHFVGWCKREEIIKYAERARALIVPSRVIEPFGLVIWEAAMSGLPIVVTDRAFAADNIEANGFGRKFDVTDVSGLGQLLRYQFADDAAVEKMSRRAHEAALALCHTPETWINAFVKLFKRKLGIPN